eukprot:35656-Eustigmatos_ZCMA.PRE.1
MKEFVRIDCCQHQSASHQYVIADQFTCRSYSEERLIKTAVKGWSWLEGLEWASLRLPEVVLSCT